MERARALLEKSPTANERFLNLALEKQERVEMAAVAEFAAKGYSLANTNDIAAQAGISVGALFKYFDNKSALFQHITWRTAKQIEQFVTERIDQGEPVLVVIEKILRKITETSREQSAAVQLYQLTTSSRDTECAQHIALTMERFTSGIYTEMMRRAQADGVVRGDIEPEYLALFLDDIFMNLQFSISSEYPAERRKIYIGNRSDEDCISATMKFITSAIAPMNTVNGHRQQTKGSVID